MMLTTKGRYAVMAVVDIAMNDKGKPITLLEVSSRLNIALNYLEQIFSKLKNSGIVKSSRGPGGGYKLASDSNRIKVGHIIDAVEEEIKITRCNEEEKSCMKSNVKCATHDLWNSLGKNIKDYLYNVSIKDVVEGDIA